MKFHAILHLWTDIINFGVPKEYDTGSNESHHKPTKVAAKLTQKKAETFIFQTCTHLDEYLLIDLAMVELMGKKVWDYFLHHGEQEDSDSDLEMEQAPNVQGHEPPEAPPINAEQAPTDAEEQEPDVPISVHTGGSSIVVWQDPDVEDHIEALFFAMPGSLDKVNAGAKMNTLLLSWLVNLQDKLYPVLQGHNLTVLTEHKCDSQIFCGHPNFHGSGPW